jgi:hypothetical protein
VTARAKLKTPRFPAKNAYVRNGTRLDMMAAAALGAMFIRLPKVSEVTENF